MPGTETKRMQEANPRLNCYRVFYTVQEQVDFVLACLFVKLNVVMIAVGICRRMNNHRCPRNVLLLLLAVQGVPSYSCLDS